MKALVLTFDKYRPFATHMIMCYEQLWPNHPFTFRIPYQSDEVKDYYESKFGSKVEMIKSPSGIVDTMFALSDDLDENEWIYWCMDDRYPIKIDVPELKKMYDWVTSPKGNNLTSLMFISAPYCWTPNRCYGRKYDIKTGDQRYVRRKDFMMIWNHQFMRVGFCRFFFNHFPRNMKNAKQMDYIRDTIILPDKYKLYMLDHNIAVYGEHTSRGMISKTCLESFKEKGLPIPEGFALSDKVMQTGNTTVWDNKIFVLKYRIKKLIGKI